MTVESTSLAADRRETFVLQEIQPGLLGLMDGSVSSSLSDLTHYRDIG